MDSFESLIRYLDSFLGSAAYFPFLLLAVGVFFTLYLGFPQIRFFSHAWKVLLGKYAKQEDKGDTTHLQALSTALSGTIGTGNIGGVAFAIYLGGPAALFWMWVTAFVGMTTKYVEVTISHQYRDVDATGRIAGGPMYYMEKGLNMRWLAIFFALATLWSSFGSGNMPQSNNMAAGLEASFGIPTWVSGGILAIALTLVIIGGVKRIAAVAARIVPVMGVFYALAALAVAIANIENIVPSFIAIFKNAFTGSAATGGFLGASFAYAFNRGVNRGLFSNEAGQGSAPIAHAAAKTEDAPAEGMVSILEPFIDTLIVCSLTGLVILSSGVWHQKFDNEFSNNNTIILTGLYTDQSASDRKILRHHIASFQSEGKDRYFNGAIHVKDGLVQKPVVSVVHNRSLAEDVVFSTNGVSYTGVIVVEEGAIKSDDIDIRGRSLIHSVPLTAKAFSTGIFGNYGQYIVTISLVLFAFSTAVAWSYYGDRAVTYLFGVAWIMPYRLLYVLAFFSATIIDTSIVWLISGVTLALMTIPNLIGLFLIRREVKALTMTYARKIDRS